MQKKILLFFIVIHCFMISLYAIGMTEYEKCFYELLNIKAIPENVFTLKNVVIKRDVAKFEFIEGDLYCLSAVNGKNIGAYFVGKGNFSFSPSTKIEKDQLERVKGKRNINEKFTKLLLIFSDSTLIQLQQLGERKKKDKIHIEIQRDIEKHIEYLVYKKREYCNSAIMLMMLSDKPKEIFYAEIISNKFEPTFFMINPYEVEEIRYMRRMRVPSFLHMPEVICQFHKLEDYENKDNLANENKEIFCVSEYKVNALISKKMKFSANVNFEILSLYDEQEWIKLFVFEDMEIDSVLTNDGTRLDFFKGKKNPYLWIEFPTKLNCFDSCNLTIYFHGNLIKRGGNLVIIRDQDFWFPQYFTKEFDNFEITLTIPKQYDVLCIGELVNTEIKDDYKTTKWVTKVPSNLAPFNMGKFKTEEIRDERIPKVTVMMAHKEKDVGIDVANSLNFYQKIFGKTPLEHFYVTEIHHLKGEAYPGLINLSYVTFKYDNRSGFHELFRAHEVAHQWWGAGLDAKTYHDQWLIEGLAHFCGLWYTQKILSDSKKYFEFLKDWQEQLVHNRDYLFSEGQKAAPLWLGYRTSSSTTKGDFYLIIYCKGAWIFHMLRNMMIDFNTMNEDRFENMLKDFYNTYKGHSASTEDFKSIVEKHMNMDMNWFFNQWVYGSDIPEYKFDYEISEISDGKYKVHCTVTQEKVPEDFQMYIPLELQFKNKVKIILRAHVKGHKTEFDLPIMDMKPKKIIFNTLYSVLCKM